MRENSQALFGKIIVSSFVLFFLTERLATLYLDSSLLDRVLFQALLILTILPGLYLLTPWLLQWTFNLEPVASSDFVWTLEDAENKFILSTVVRLKGKADAHKIRKTFHERVFANSSSKYSKLKKYTYSVLGFAFWKEEEHFDIERHIYEEDLKTEFESMEDDVRMMAERKLRKCFPEKMSPWEMIIVRNESKNLEEFYMLIRVHHVISDGVSLTSMLSSTVIDKPCVQSLSSRAETRRVDNSPKSPLLWPNDKGLFSSLWLNAKKLVLLTWLYIKCIVCYPSFMLKYLSYKKPSTFIVKKLRGTKISVVSKQINMKVLKDKKNASNTSVSAVILSSLITALKKFCEETKSNSPEKIVFILPFLMKMPQEGSGLTNSFVFGIQEFGTRFFDLHQQLQTTHRALVETIYSPNSQITTFMMTRMLGMLPQWFIKLFPNNSSIHATFSNLPGPSECVSMFGYDVLDIFFLNPQKGNVGLSVSLLSYAGGFRIGITADTAVIDSRIKLKIIMDELIDQL